MAKNEWQELFKKYLDNQLSREEFLRLHDHISEGYDRPQIEALLKQAIPREQAQTPGDDQQRQEAFAEVIKAIREKEKVERPFPTVRFLPRQLRYRRFYQAAAVLILLFLVGGLYRSSRPSRSLSKDKPAALAAEIPPGRTGAVLTLADGRQLSLDSAGSGHIGQQGNVLLIKQQGQLSYRPSDVHTIDPAHAPRATGIVFNTMTTARGRQFQLTLADGTNVWLNAASSIKFPVAFTGRQRRVEVTGEAYFEVAPDKNKPFIVQADSSEITVMGTHFNIMNYKEEDKITTTLSEGAVQVSHAGHQILLAPGGQAKLDRHTGRLSSGQVDPGQITGWTKGRLYLGNADFSGLMRQISRWYDVDVKFEGKVPDLQVGGFVHKDVNLSTVMGFLGDNGIHYKIEGTTISILP